MSGAAAFATVRLLVGRGNGVDAGIGRIPSLWPQSWSRAGTQSGIVRVRVQFPRHPGSEGRMYTYGTP
jgi:hypothetical protein